MTPTDEQEGISAAAVLMGVLALASFVAYIAGTWHAFVGEGTGAGLASAFLVLPAWYYFVKMLLT